MQDGAPIIIKKVKKHGHGHHGGAWKVALADFMTAMMAFFLVMWITGLSPEVRKEIEGYFNDPIGFMNRGSMNPVSVLPNSGPRTQPNKESGTEKRRLSQQQEIEKVEQQLTKVIEADPQLKKLKQGGFIELNISDNGLIIEFVENQENGEVFFAIGSSQIRPAARAIVAKVARVLASTGRKVEIQGHTDSRPYPSKTYDNFDLSGDRANSVRRLMVGAGLRQSQVESVDALADTQPRVPGDPKHFSNRRVTVLLPFAGTPNQIKDLPKDGFAEDREAHFLIPKDIRPPVVNLEKQKESSGQP